MYSRRRPSLFRTSISSLSPCPNKITVSVLHKRLSHRKLWAISLRRRQGEGGTLFGTLWKKENLPRHYNRISFLARHEKAQNFKQKFPFFSNRCTNLKPLKNSPFTSVFSHKCERNGEFTFRQIPSSTQKFRIRQRK